MHEERQHPKNLLPLLPIAFISHSFPALMITLIAVFFLLPLSFYRPNLFMVDGCAWPLKELTLTILCRDLG